MAGCVGFRERPPKVPCDPKETTVQIHMGTRMGPNARALKTLLSLTSSDTATPTISLTY